MVRKRHLPIGIYKIVRIRYKVASIYSFLREKLNLHSQPTNCVSYYDAVIDHDVI